MTAALLLPKGSPSALLQKQRMSVNVQGELVVLTVGNTDLKMPYETALQLSQWLRIRGKEAKRKAGDMSRHWSAIAVLDKLPG